VKKITILLVFFLIIFLPALSQAKWMTAGHAAAGKTVLPESSLSENEYEDEGMDEDQEIADPLKSWNRLMFTFNDRVYFWVLKPAAQGYNRVVPEDGRIAVRHFFYNITMPIRFGNSILQGKVQRAGMELARFGINSSVGLLGFFDVAADNTLEKPPAEDLGQTLGFYGFGDGLYIVWPLLGFSSLRDTIGFLGDGYLNPINYLSDSDVVLGVKSYRILNDVSLIIGEYEDFKDAAIDPYTAFKEAYYQYRQAQIKK
jgi:phospholipid-binding lipoprotein MlaA